MLRSGPRSIPTLVISNHNYMVLPNLSQSRSSSLTTLNCRADCCELHFLRSESSSLEVLLPVCLTALRYKSGTRQVHVRKPTLQPKDRNDTMNALRSVPPVLRFSSSRYKACPRIWFNIRFRYATVSDIIYRFAIRAKHFNICRTPFFI